jgi:hypothetical protein
LRPGHDHPVVVLTIATALGALAGFLVDSAGLVVLALLDVSVATADSYLLLIAGGVGLLAASLAWRRLRPPRYPELQPEGEAERAE